MGPPHALNANIAAAKTMHRVHHTIGYLQIERPLKQIPQGKKVPTNRQAAARVKRGTTAGGHRLPYRPSRMRDKPEVTNDQPCL